MDKKHECTWGGIILIMLFTFAAVCFAVNTPPKYVSPCTPQAAECIDD